MKSIPELKDSLPQTGRVIWIGVRPERRGELQPLERVEATTQAGLAGDHNRRAGGKRQVTLIQAEHLQGVGSMLGRNEAIPPGLTRRNIVVAGINLLALQGRRFEIGTALLEATGPCHPCSRMEENLGPGGYNAMRGHGGITARVLRDGDIALGDAVRLAQTPADE
jgi:MOSC domain-containing protein YiiM